MTPGESPGVQIEYRRMLRMLRRASQKGATRSSPTGWEWDIAGRCEAPVCREVYSRPEAYVMNNAKRQAWMINELARIYSGERKPTDRSPDGIALRPPSPATVSRRVLVKPGLPHLLQLRMHVRCRQCERCRAMKRADWYMRARLELEQAPRTWFGTLTFNDVTNYKALLLARQRARKRSLVWEQITPDVQFNMHSAAAYTEYIQPFWKRVRKAAGAKTLRYLAVAEAGTKGGRLHFHLLVHEVDEGAPIRWKQLHDNWFGNGIGIDEFKLVKPDEPWAVRYVTKYIAKGMEARVRASARYGKRSLITTKCEEVKTPTHNKNTSPGAQAPGQGLSTDGEV